MADLSERDREEAARPRGSPTERSPESELEAAELEEEVAMVDLGARGGGGYGGSRRTTTTTASSRRTSRRRRARGGDESRKRRFLSARRG
nr:unnamed protein product [Digitaria exilis]